MAATKLLQWADKQKQQSLRYVSLHDTIFGINKYRYFIYRTRYVFIAAFLRTSVHIAELLLVVQALPIAVHALMFARLTSVAVESGWWGLTESMRKRIRWQRQEGNMAAVQHEIQGWISLAFVAALVTLVLSLGIFCIVRQYNTLLTSLLVLVIGLQTGVRIINRTFYSGAYAIRRVFLPVEMIIIPELLITVLGLLLHKEIGGWSVILCLLLANFVGTLIHYKYVRNISDFLRIMPKRIFSPRAFKSVFENHGIFEVTAPAMAALCMRLLEVGLITTVQILSERNTALEQILYPLYITMPLVRSAANWGQVTYFDLTKYGLDYIYKFRNMFERLCLEFSMLLSFCFCGFAMALIVLFAHDYILQSAQVILPHIIMCSMFGFILIALFSRQKYAWVTLLCCLQYAIFLYLMLFKFASVPLWLILVLSSLPPLVIGWLILLPAWQAPESALRGFTQWLNFVRSSDTPCVLVKFTLAPSCSGILRRRFIKTLLAQVKSGDLITLLKSGKIVLSMPSANFGGHMTRDYWIRLGGGHITGVEVLLTTDDADALNKFIEHAPGTSEMKEKQRLETLVAYFREHFPDGIIQYPMQPEPLILKTTASEERRMILHASKSQLDGGKMPSVERWHVNIGIVSGLIACIFLLPRGTPTDKVRSWKQLLQAY